MKYKVNPKKLDLDPKKKLPKISTKEFGGLGGILAGDKPVRPLDTDDPWPKKREDDINWWEWVVEIDRQIGLEPEAARRIQREIRKIVYAEVAAVSVPGNIIIQATDQALRIGLM